MSISLRRLCASPPALRTEIVRHALLGQEQAKVLLPTRRCIHVCRKTHAFQRPRIAFINKNTRHRFESTATASSATTPSPPTPSQPSAAPAPTKSRTRRFVASSALVLLFFTVGFTMSAAPAAETVNGYVNPPNDAETLHLYHPSTPAEKQTNTHILNHPLATQLRADPSMSESRPLMRIPAALRPHSLTAGTLLGEGMIEVPPLCFNDKRSALPTMTQLMYLGSNLCGHPEVVHGGLLATLLDEGLARACFPALPHKVGVTASLKIDYRKPCPAGSYVVLKAETLKVEGRKVWAKGWIELLGDEAETDGVKLVEAEALFIEPKNAKNMAQIVSSE